MSNDFPLEFRVTIHPTSTSIPVKNPHALFTKYKAGDIIKKNESGATHDLEVINKEVLYRWGSTQERYLFDMGVKQLDQPCHVDEKSFNAPADNHLNAHLKYSIVDEEDRALDFPIPDIQAIQRMLEKGDKIYTTTEKLQITSTIIKHEEVHTSGPGGSLNILLKTFVDVNKTPKP
ncbi:hypothetical protein [Pseudomonas alkylphenolica]|uniref:hypothetical protein n=1 Tax=Pseudomonas alkylphenolica TaxID=237609 RepID=UPI0018D74212|nr:hypothetical protein [Pseudomonas alkylphenolica]MBH3430760.1 hypothetical protein [Pseudomonas alkylphenolica]